MLVHAPNNALLTIRIRMPDSAPQPPPLITRNGSLVLPRRLGSFAIALQRKELIGAVDAAAIELRAFSRDGRICAGGLGRFA
jgi:hypothetical protein